MKTRKYPEKSLGIDVYGTITAPKDERVHAAVVFVAGSGPTDRDWCSPILPGTNGSAKLFAEALAHQGFVTLRYDKLASGPHVRENIPKLIGKISMQSHIEELKGAVETLVGEKNVDKNCLFVLANSEGTIHAVNYQLQTKSNHFKGLVLTGAPGRTLGAVSHNQILNQVKQLPDGEAQMKIYDGAMADFVACKPLPNDAVLPEGTIKMVVLSLYSPVSLPFSRELWSYSLPEQLAKVDVPVLVVIGKKDFQIDWKADGHELEKATAQKAAVSFIYPENANHVLKHETKPREELNAQTTQRYNEPGIEIDEEATNTSYKWLKEQTQA